MMLIWLVLLILAVAAVFWFFKRAPYLPQTGGSRSSALEVLEERYARGEVGRDEYLQKKDDIQNRSGG